MRDERCRGAKASAEKDVPAGPRIITEGDPADSFYVLLGGRVRVLKASADEPEQELASLGPGQFFGELGLLGSIPRTASVEVTERARLLDIPGDDFVAALTRSPASPAFMEVTRRRSSRIGQPAQPRSSDHPA